jgi:hypothetical protein
MIENKKSMTIRSLLENWNMTGLKLKFGFLETEWKPVESDKEAAWELYVELLTRVVTQPLPDEHGDEKTALESAYSLFGLTREVLKRKGRHCIQFTKIAVIVLNQIVRPFTAKWHRLSLEGKLDDLEHCTLFREELKQLQIALRDYSHLLADIAEVEDLTELTEISA